MALDLSAISGHDLPMSYQTLRTNPRRLPVGIRLRWNNVPLHELGLRSSGLTALRADISKPGPQRPRLVSSAHGPIKRILLTFPASPADTYSYRGVYRDLVASLPKTTEFIVV